MTLILLALAVALPHWPNIAATAAICAVLWRLTDNMENPNDD
jgi:hypothetical protein